MIRILLIAMALLLSVPFAASAELQQANNTATHLTVYDAGQVSTCAGRKGPSRLSSKAVFEIIGSTR